MKILMIAPEPFFEPRGTPISVYQRLIGLSKLGHKIDLATYHLGEDVKIPRINIHRIHEVSQIKSIKVGPSWQKIPLDILLIIKSAILLFKNDYDVIHSHEEAGFFSILLAWLFRKQHLYDMHSSLPNQLENFRFCDNRLMVGLFKYLEKLVINTCDAIITIGPDLEQHVLELNPQVPIQMIENLPFGRNENSGETPEQLRRRIGLDDKLVIVYTGNFETYQGIDLLLESAEIVVRRYPLAIFILVGGKPNQIDMYKDMIANRHLDGSVRFMGTMSFDETNSFVDMADILVSPRTEGTSIPLKLYAYLQSGKPILATNLAAHTLVLDHTTAELVEPTKDAIAEGFMKLLDDKDLRRSLGVQCQELFAGRYNEANYIAKLEKIYEEFQSPKRAEAKHVTAAKN